MYKILCLQVGQSQQNRQIKAIGKIRFRLKCNSLHLQCFNNLHHLNNNSNSNNNFNNSGRLVINAWPSTGRTTNITPSK